MHIVDDKGMGMFESAPGPDGIAEMRMIRRQVRVDVLDDVWIVRGPKHRGEHCPQRRQAAEHDQSDAHACFGTEPPRQRIGYEPACVRKRKVRGEQRRTILLGG